MLHQVNPVSPELQFMGPFPIAGTEDIVGRIRSSAHKCTQSFGCGRATLHGPLNLGRSNNRIIGEHLACPVCILLLALGNEKPTAAFGSRLW